MFNNDLLKDLSQRINDLHSYLQIDNKEIEIANEEERAASPNFWDNPKEAEAFMQQLRSKKKWVEAYHSILNGFNDLEGLVQCEKEGEASDEDVDAQYQSTL